MREKLDNIKTEAQEELKQVASIQELENIRLKYLGKKRRADFGASGNGCPERGGEAGDRTAGE